VGLLERRQQDIFELKSRAKYLQNFHILMAIEYKTSNESSISDLHDEVVM
jgi:hypothetical protein